MSTVEKISQDLANIAHEAVEQFDQMYSAQKEMPTRDILRAVVTSKLTNSLDRIIDRTVNDLLRKKIEESAPAVVDNIFAAWVKSGAVHVEDIPEETRVLLKEEFDRLTKRHLIRAPERMMIAVERAIRRGEQLDDIANSLGITLKQAKAIKLKAEKSAARVKWEYGLWFGEEPAG